MDDIDIDWGLDDILDVDADEPLMPLPEGEELSSFEVRMFNDVK